VSDEEFAAMPDKKIRQGTESGVVTVYFDLTSHQAAEIEYTELVELAGDAFAVPSLEELRGIPPFTVKGDEDVPDELLEALQNTSYEVDSGRPVVITEMIGDR
jgi:hypothetical protein